MPVWLRGELSLTSGLDFRSGDYGEPLETDILYAPFSLTYLLDDFVPSPWPDDQLELRVTVPFLSVEGPHVRNPAQRDLESGLGDVILRATYIAFPRAPVWLPATEISGRLQLPTASRRDGLGTGQPAYEIELGLYESFGPLTPLVSVGHRWVERAPGFDLHDTLFASGGAVWRLASRASAGLLFDWREAPSSFSTDQRELFAYLSLRLRPDLRAAPYGVIGLSRSSADYAIGLQLRVSLEIR